MTYVPLNNVQRKAVRLTEEGRVHVSWQSRDGVAGHGLVDGDTDTYACSFSPAGRICTCPLGRTMKDCSHALALWLKVYTSQDEPLQFTLELVK